MPVGRLVDVRRRGNAGEREQNDAGGYTPTTIRVCGYVTIDVLHP
jgi:hypothetical protein